MPPMNIRVRDHRQFGRKPTVGIHVLKSLEEFRCDPVQAELEEDDDGVQGKLPYTDQPCPHTPTNPVLVSYLYLCLIPHYEEECNFIAP